MNPIENPESKLKTAKENPEAGLTARSGGRTAGHGPGGRTGDLGGRTGEEQRANTVLKTAREQDLKSI